MKKIGKAKADLNKELWTTELGEVYFHMNRRLIEGRPDVKKFLSKYKKVVNAPRPSVGQRQKRDEYFKTREESQRQLRLFMSRIFKEILDDSFSGPIALRQDRDYDHNSDWRFCLYKGNIYQFDKPGLSGDEMIRQIEAVEGPFNEENN